MVCGKLYRQFTRYKTLQCIVIVVITLAFFSNVLLLVSTKFIINDDGKDSALRTFTSTGATRVIARDSRANMFPRVNKPGRDPLSKEEVPKEDGLINLKNTVWKPNVSLSRDTLADPLPIRDTLLDPSLSRDTLSDPLLSIPDGCRTWCRLGEKLSPPYKLTAVLLVRVYREDLAGLSSREMLQWLFYLRYAGFQHVFVYDAYVSKNESQYHVLLPLVQSGFITYTDWSAHNPYTIKGTQMFAYQHCINKYGRNLTWHMAMDIDEYPFSPTDVEPNFMQRFLQKFFVEKPHVSQVTLQNYLFLGKPLDPQANPLLIGRFRRRTHSKANDLGKSVVRVAQLGAAKVHHHEMRNGKTEDSDARVMRLNHYWGARLQNWGEDTKKILDITEPDYSIEPIVDQLSRCSKCFGLNSLYEKRWN